MLRTNILLTCCQKIFFLSTPDIMGVCILELAALVIFLQHLRHSLRQAVSVIFICLSKPPFSSVQTHPSGSVGVQRLAVTEIVHAEKVSGASKWLIPPYAPGVTCWE